MAVSLSWTVTVTNTSDTAATVKVILKAKSTYGSWNGNARSGYITIDGTKYTFSHSFASNTTTTLATKSKSISRTTASKSISIKASYSTGVSSGTITKSGSTTVAARPKYTVKFETNSGTNEKSVSVFSGYNTTFPTTTKTGYSFLGWYTTNSTSGTKYAAGAQTPSITSSRTYYAQWKKIEYTISYDLNGGTVSSSNKTKYDIETTSFSLVNPTKTGYKFLGWTGTGLSSKSTSVTISKGSTGNRSYTANWEINTYTITLKPQGGTVSQTSLIKTYGKSLTLPSPTRESYEFIEWNTQSDGEGAAYNTAYTANATATLYAIWEQSTVSITAYYYQVPNSTSSKYTYKKAANKTLKLTDPPDISNYVFDGWYTTTNFSGDKITSIGANSSITNIYAKWTPTYTLTYKINDRWIDGIAPIGIISSSEHKSGESVTLASAADNFSYVDADGEIKATASGWNTHADGGGTPYIDKQKVSFSANAGTEKILYAQWTAQEFNLTFDPGEGSGNPYNSSLDYQYTYNFVNPSNFNFTPPTNYTFSYWEAEDGTIYKIGDSFTINTNHTFIARWETAYKIPNISFSVQRTEDNEGSRISETGTYIKIDANGSNGYYISSGSIVKPIGNLYKYKIKGIFSNENSPSDYVIEEDYITANDTVIDTNNIPRISQYKIFNDNREYTNCEITFEDLSEYDSSYIIPSEDRIIKFTFTIPLKRALAMHIANDLKAISLFEELQNSDEGLVVYKEANIKKDLVVNGGINVGVLSPLYRVVTTIGETDSPIEKGYYTFNPEIGIYTLSTDTSPVAGTTYYRTLNNSDSFSFSTWTNDIVENKNLGITLQHNIDSTSNFYNAQRPDTDTSISFGIGSSGTNAGIYSHNLKRWLIYTNSAGSTHILGNDITISGHSSTVGSINSGTGTATLAHTTSLTKLVDLVTLDEGAWILTVDVDFPAINSNGTRGFEIFVNGTGYSSTYTAFKGEYCRQAHQVTIQLRTTSSLDIDLHARQSSEESATVTYRWRVMRII